MRKLVHKVDPITDPRQAGPRLWRNGSIFVLVVISTPIALEVGNLLYARWRSILDRSIEVRTPILDWIQMSGRNTHESVSTAVSTQMRGFSWQSSLILPFVAAAIIIAMLFLGRAHHDHR